MHDLRIVSLDKEGLVPTPGIQGAQIRVAGTSLGSWARNLVTVEMQNRKDCAISHRIEEVDRLPATFEGAGLGFSVANDAGNNQIGIVECGAKRMNQRVTKLTTLMHRIRNVRPAVAGNPARRRELAEHESHPVFIGRDLRVNLSVRAFQIRTGVQRGASVSWA